MEMPPGSLEARGVNELRLWLLIYNRLVTGSLRWLRLVGTHRERSSNSNTELISDSERLDD
jgi:hypothetical protein